MTEPLNQLRGFTELVITTWLEHFPKQCTICYSATQKELNHEPISFLTNIRIAISENCTESDLLQSTKAMDRKDFMVQYDVGENIAFRIDILLGDSRYRQLDAAALSEVLHSSIQLCPGIHISLVDLTCPIVHISYAEYAYVVSQTTNNSLHSMNKRIFEINGSYFACVNEYFDFMSNTLRDKIPRTVVIEAFCWTTISASIICCISTIVYFISKLPDPLHFSTVNVLLSCTYLVVVQSATLFGYYQSPESLTCTVTGIVMHIFWLAKLFSVNGYSLVLVFIRIRQRNFSPSIKFLLLFNVLYSVIPSAMIVLLASMYSYGMGQQLNYGGSFCFFTDFHTSLVPFTSFVALILLTNTIIPIVIRISFSLPSKSIHDAYSFIGFTILASVNWTSYLLIDLSSVCLFIFLFCNTMLGIYTVTVFTSFNTSSPLLRSVK